MASGQSGDGGQAVKLEDTFTLLESQELTVVEEIRHLILEHLSSGKEPWLANSLVDYYYQSRSVRAQEIIIEVREPLDKTVLDKIVEGLRAVDTRLQAMQLLLYIVDHQPPWTHRLADRPVFPAFLKCLKTELDIPILMTGVMVMVILLPVVPVSVESHLNDVFDIFARIAGLIIKKPGNSPDVFMLHLNIGVYVLFLRLYGMFPCSFLHFLANNYSKKENLMVYSEIIAPILEKVRLHPNLVLGSKDAETSKSRWRKVEPQDIVVNCAKMSLDPIEGTREDLQCPIIPRPHPPISTSMKPPPKQPSPQDAAWQEKMERVSEMFPVVVDPASYGFSPSQWLGLATPPSSQRATPAASFNEPSSSVQHSAGGTVSASPRIVTPTPEVTPRDMIGEEADRVAGMSNKFTPVPPRSGPKTTPTVGNRTQGSSAFTSPFLFRPPTSSQSSSVAPSPMKANLSSDSLSSQVMDSAAARTLTFDKTPEAKEGVPRHIELRVGKEGNTGIGAAGSVLIDSLPAIVRSLSAQDSEPLDQEVSRITEAEEGFDGGAGLSGMDETTSTSASKHLQTPESVIQYMKQVNRIRFNSLTLHTTEPAVIMGGNKAQPGRARSCPPLRRKPLTSDPHHPPFSNAVATSKLDTVSESAVTMHMKGRETSFLARQLSRQFSKSASKDGSEASSSTHTQTCQCQCGKDGESWGRVQQVASVFQCLLAPVRVAVCGQCQQTLISAQPGKGDHGAAPPEASATESWISWPVGERALYSVLSPPELLDRHLMQGSELHAKELAHVPLTGQQNISWTHFGGGPPVDEINILRGEILLLQNQVMYERHKRSNHAMRNRRLLRRIAHVSALEQQVQALTNQINGRDKDIQNLQVSLKLLQDHNHQLQQTNDSDEYEKLVDFKTTIQQNKDLQEANVELKNLLLTQKAENDELKMELQEARAQCFELKKDNQMMCVDMEHANKWKQQVEQLQKEMLLMGEAHERLENHLSQQHHLGQENVTLASNMLVQALHADIKALKRDKTANMLKMDASLCRLADLEEFAKSKDMVMAEMKNNFEVSKTAHAQEIKAVEDKYKSMVHINQELQAAILRLWADNNCLQQKLVSTQLRVSRRRGDSGGSDQAGTSTDQDPSPNPDSCGGEARQAEEGAGMDVRDSGGSLRSSADSGSGRGSVSTSQVPHSSQDTHCPSGAQAVMSSSIPATSSRKSSKDPAESSSAPTKSSIPSAQSASTKASNISVPSSDTAKSDDNPASSAGFMTSLSHSSKSSQNPMDQKDSEGGQGERGESKKDSEGERGESKKDHDGERGESQGDTVSELSEGGQGLVETRAMLYTDSEDNASLSSSSNLTADSGVYSKVEHPH